jgi:hypothetical protein
VTTAQQNCERFSQRSSVNRQVAFLGMGLPRLSDTIHSGENKNLKKICAAYIIAIWETYNINNKSIQLR